MAALSFLFFSFLGNPIMRLKQQSSFISFITICSTPPVAMTNKKINTKIESGYQQGIINSQLFFF
jgi:hypothetical protein